MRKKYMVCAVLISAVLIQCGQKQIKDVDLSSKGLIKVRIIVREDSELGKIAAKSVYFKRLEDPNDFTKGKIIKTSLFEDNKSALNVIPGTYVVIAITHEGTDGKNIVCFSEDVMKKTKIELKAGDTVDLGEIYTIETSATLLGTVTEIQNIHRKIINSEYENEMVRFRLGSIDKEMYRKTKEEKEAEKKKEEEYKQEIEKHE